MTAILAIQHKNRVCLAGDTRITNDSEYTDGITKVFKVNQKVLAGVCGDANLIDPFRRLLPNLRSSTGALDAARTLQNVLSSMNLPKDLEFSFLFVSKGESAELGETGLLSFPLVDGGTARAGSGGLVADVYWHSQGGSLGSIRDAQDRLQEAVATASKWRTDCGPTVRMVVST